MTVTQTTILGVIQGLTEFLPISSSAHLILVTKFTVWPDQGVSFDLALHLGTLMAVVLYFWKDIKTISRDSIQSIRSGQSVGQSQLALALFIGTIPAIILGCILFNEIDAVLRSIQVILFTTVVFAILLGYADLKSAHNKSLLKSLSLKHALIIGVSQSISLIPGVSRSGITITTGLMLGYDKVSASRFSFLLAIPITLAAAVAKLIQLYEQKHLDFDWLMFLLGTLIAFVTALAAIHYFLKWLDRFGMMPYVIYRLVLALILVNFL